MALSILLMADAPAVTAAKSRCWRDGAEHAFQRFGVVARNVNRYEMKYTIDSVAQIVDSVIPQLRRGAGRSHNHEN